MESMAGLLRGRDKAKKGEQRRELEEGKTPTQDDGGDGTISSHALDRQNSLDDETPLLEGEKRSGSVEPVRHPLIMNKITRDSMRYLDLLEANRK